jgi:riboflavin synthase
MFTGIVERMGTVAAADRSEGGMRVEIGAEDLGLRIGDSIAVNGVCNLGDLEPGSGVNLERPMRADGRFDGHIVQGHVDGVGIVVGVDPEGDGKRISIQVPPGLSKYVAEKGSIAVDGVSLTVAAANVDEFEVALIPHTLIATTLGGRAPGSRVNLEVDVIAKYVERMMSGSGA